MRMSGPERREQLIGVAKELFAEQGYESTSVEEIADRAGVTKPVVYEHFGNKEVIYTVVADREVRNLVDRIKQALAPGHPRRTIVHAIDAFLSYVEDDEAGFGILIRDRPAGTGGGTLPNALDEVAEAVEELLLTELKERGYNRRMAPILARCLVGMIAMPGQWWQMADGPSRSYVAKQIVNLAWNGIGNLKPN
jgi:AcrR family transcriptional regulator